MGGTARHNISIPANQLSQNQYHVLGTSLGTKQHLITLTDLICKNKITPPIIHTYSVNTVNKMHKDLRNSAVIGRAVLSLSMEVNGN